MTDRGAYDEVYVYTMGRPGFQLQYVVDAYAAQEADAQTKSITLVFALVGLYLHLEGGRTGHEVQQIHMRMGRDRREWPHIIPPQERGTITPGGRLGRSTGTRTRPGHRLVGAETFGRRTPTVMTRRENRGAIRGGLATEERFTQSAFMTTVSAGAEYDDEPEHEDLDSGRHAGVPGTP